MYRNLRYTIHPSIDRCLSNRSFWNAFRANKFQHEAINLRQTHTYTHPRLKHNNTIKTCKTIDLRASTFQFYFFKHSWTVNNERGRTLLQFSSIIMYWHWSKMFHMKSIISLTKWNFENILVGRRFHFGCRGLLIQRQKKKKYIYFVNVEWAVEWMRHTLASWMQNSMESISFFHYYLQKT